MQLKHHVRWWCDALLGETRAVWRAKQVLLLLPRPTEFSMGGRQSPGLPSALTMLSLRQLPPPWAPARALGGDREALSGFLLPTLRSRNARQWAETIHRPPAFVSPPQGPLSCIARKPLFVYSLPHVSVEAGERKPSPCHSTLAKSRTPLSS